MKRSLFTLIELLVVIGIIGILMAILLPAISSAVKEGKKTRAESDCKQIALAVSAYLNDYQSLPLDDKSRTDTTFVFGGTGGASSQPANDSLQVILFGSDASGNATNTRKKVFFSTNVNSRFLNPWDNEYSVRLDFDYNNSIDASAGSTSGSVAVWTDGPGSEVLTSWEE